MDKRDLDELIKNFEIDINNMSTEEFEKFCAELGIVDKEEKDKPNNISK